MFKKKRGKKVVVILLILLVVWCSFFTTDYIRASNNLSPIFAIPIATFRDGGSTMYLGAGYMVITYVYWVNNDEEPTMFIHNKYERVDIGTWFMRYDR
jgi:ABC-type uncharacterized transport system YnjBCD permease subunit